ncbi:MAG TPA: diguanylate cyclase [Novosphingobium sp.]|nr:diguanylate cyclase [Novosphingobium sp.]
MALLWALIGSVEARADGVLPAAFAPGSQCHIALVGQSESEALARPGSGWVCSPRDYDIAAPRVLLRFDLRGVAALPDELVTSLTRFTRMGLTVIGASGRIAHRDITEAAMQPGLQGWTMRTALPVLAGERPAAVVIAVDGITHPRLLSMARLESAGEAASVDLGQALLVAALCGMLFVPILANIAFYRVLRERFLLWHTLAVALMLLQTLVTSGLINAIARFTVGEISILSGFTLGGGIAAAALFSANLIEEGKLDPLHRRLLAVAGGWIMAGVLVYLWGASLPGIGEALRPYVWTVYYAQYLPVLALFVWTITVALLRGSRAVRFQIVAWAPFMVLGLVRIGSSLGLAPVPMEMASQQHLCITWEVIVTALAVVDRFMTLKRERDDAQAEIRLMATLVDQDPLTGLLNRRALESRFAELQRAGFRAMAVIDLDHFKAINDTHGHAMGDAVLKIVAEVLASDRHTISVRMGGEEFLLLMAGNDIAERAERRRQAISVRVSAKLPGLDRMVTASMGLAIDLPWPMGRTSFPALYEQCDRLLYEAKHGGRNRSSVEQRIMPPTGRLAAAQG